MNSNAKPEYYIEASVEVPNEYADAVSNFMIDNICEGLVLEGEESSPLTVIKFYASPEVDFEAALSAFLKDLFGGDECEIKTRKIKNVEWEDEYKKQAKAVRIADDVIIRPPWEPAPEAHFLDIIIEPKMAFGTGTHETTRSCIETIRKNFKSGSTFLDMGCGSGVLSILAARLGASFIKAIDYDPVAVENSHENFQINGVEAIYEIVHGSIERTQNDKPYDFVCANIIKTVIVEMLPRLKQATRSGGQLLLSGLLDTDLDEVLAGMTELDLSEYAVIEDNEWRTVLIRKG